MKVRGLSRWVSAAALMTALVLVFACSSSGPSGPSALGKGLYRDTVTDSGGAVVPGAEIFVDGAVTGVTTDVNGEFQIDLSSGPHRLTATSEGVEVWSKDILIEEEEEDPEEVLLEEEEDVSNGIGPCVSECTHIYNPSKRDSDADELFEGKFNARHCVEFCKESEYRGGASKEEDGECNPFYTEYDLDCASDVEPPEDPLEPSGGEDPEGEEKDEAPGKPGKGGK